MDARADLPRVIGRDGARLLGFTDRMIERRLQTGQWRRLLPRTYLTADTVTGVDRCDAALLFAGPGAALSGAAALREWGVRSVSVPSRVLVVVPPENRIDSSAWVHVRRTWRTTEVCSSGRRRVLPARATADRAIEMTRIDDVRALVARVVADGHSTVELLAAELERGPRRGSALFRRALAEVCDGAASAPEARAASILRRAKLGGFEQNARIELSDGRCYVADFLWRELNAILEIDSVEYHLGPAQWRATMDRHLALSTLGYSVVHRPPSALRDAAAFADAVGSWLQSVAEARLRRTR